MTVAVAACIVIVAVASRPTFAGTSSALLAVTGFVFVLAAALGRAWTSLFIAGHKDAALVQAGPYAACRHPLYALSLLGMLGLGLATRSVVLAIALVGTAWLLHARAARTEDALLEQLHGEAARAYRDRVPGLWPDWRRYALPESLVIHPRLAAKAFLDAATLLLAFAALEIAHALQTAGVTPALVRLP
jgi:protein-S-isoprenylcysteine O-methyltransferase Ste14